MVRLQREAKGLLTDSILKLILVNRENISKEIIITLKVEVFLMVLLKMHRILLINMLELENG